MLRWKAWHHPVEANDTNLQEKWDSIKRTCSSQRMFSWLEWGRLEEPHVEAHLGLKISGPKPKSHIQFTKNLKTQCKPPPLCALFTLQVILMSTKVWEPQIQQETRWDWARVTARKHDEGAWENWQGREHCKTRFISCVSTSWIKDLGARACFKWNNHFWWDSLCFSDAMQNRGILLT